MGNMALKFYDAIMKFVQVSNQLQSKFKSICAQVLNTKKNHC